MWSEYLIFLLKTVTIVVALALLIGLLAGMARRQSDEEKGKIRVENVSKKLEKLKQRLSEALVTDKKALKNMRKAEKKAQKAAAKNSEDPAKPKAWVLDFKGDMQASQVHALAESVSAVLHMATPQDTVVLRLESPGGVVHGYGLAASQLARLKAKQLSLVIAVDKVAASGGYMMAALADRIVAAPFAVVGSIGVVAQLPNLHRFLKRNDIDIELHTAGEFKRTLTVLGENTEAGREKFKQDLENIHRLFKDHVVKARPALDINAVSTGEFWFGTDALARGLVDELATSDDLLQGFHETHQVYRVSFETPQPLAKKLSAAAMLFVDQLYGKLAGRSMPFQ
ncbi:protease SohB [Salinispirillum marinum]|uniref:Protease SohB n=2 Tax=Saccharospirillaceae TaxID=255527 RepID=A0ABV8BD63_9GAMM